MSTLIILTIVSSISLFFNTTRLLGIGCSALVVYFHPWLLVLYLGVIGLYFQFKPSK